jgi:hypothetical protein
MVSAYNLLDSYDATTISAQNVQVIAITPWLMIPAIPVIVAILAFNFLEAASGMQRTPTLSTRALHDIPTAGPPLSLS